MTPTRFPQVPWRVVVVDEAHRLRTAGNKLSDCLAAILQRGEAEYGFQMRLLMTGRRRPLARGQSWV